MWASPCQDRSNNPSLIATKKNQHSPHRWNQPTYCTKTLYANIKNADLVDAQSTLYVQQLCGTFLYYSIAVDQTMLVAFNAITTSQSHTITTTIQDIVWLLNYASTHPDATLHYHASNMILHVDRDVSYLCKECTCSWYGGFFLLANQLVNNGDKPPTLPTNNDAIHTLCQIIQNVVSSLVEAEIGATFINDKDALPIRTTIEELGHPQPPTPMKVDNTTAVGFANNTIKQKRSKAIAMHFYWIRDRTRQVQFKIYCPPEAPTLGTTRPNTIPQAITYWCALISSTTSHMSKLITS